VPANGYTFDGWSGDCSGSGSCSLTMNRDKFVTANFASVPQIPQAILTTIAGSGGTVSPDGVNSVMLGSEVIVTATALPGYRFKRWGSLWCGPFYSQNPCNFFINGNQTVTATFEKDEWQLNIQCYIECTRGITDPPAGRHMIPDGTQVTVIPFPNDGFEFFGWSDSVRCPEIGPCTFTMTEPVFLNPQFREIQ
jgi:uncharacterized repeat protein (TIGR02543 family)